MDSIVVFGTGKISDVISQCIIDEDLYTIAGYACEREYLPMDGKFRGKPVVDFHFVAEHFPPNQYAMFIAVGYQELNAMRTHFCKESEKKGYRLVSVVSPKAVVYSDIKYGENCFVMAGSLIQPGVWLGSNVFVWSGAVIGHHSQIGDNCWLTSGCKISGSVRVGRNSFFGTGSSTVNDIEIGSRCFLGADAFLSKDAPSNSVFVAPGCSKFRLQVDDFLKLASLK